MFWEKPKEKEIMGTPASEFLADVYMESVSRHFNGMVEFFNDFISNVSVISDFSPGSKEAVVWTRGSIDSCVEEIFKYYYFIFNELIFSRIKNDSEINYSTFKQSFSNKVYEKIDSSENFREKLYQNWDIEDNNISDFEGDMLDEDKITPQFYKEILPYYHKESIGSALIPAISLLTPYIESSNTINLISNDKTIVNGIIYFFSAVCFQLNCLPSTPDSYPEYYKQHNAHIFDRLLNVMIDQTYNPTMVIKETERMLGYRY
tara:strand:- start:100 stop:882 length:783 start_codon:yes stop_codon:yes gene_type:complete